MLRRLAPTARMCAMRTRALHQSATARSENASLPVEQKEKSLVDNVKSLTGKTGPIIAAGALATYAYANELLLLHAESVVVVSFAACCYGLYTKGSDVLYGMINEERDAAVKRFDVAKNQSLDSITNRITHLKSQLNVKETIEMRYAVSKEMATMEEELFYRKRNNALVNDYKHFLDAAAATATAERKAEQMRIVDALESDFLASFNAQGDKAVVANCIANLQTVKF